MASFSITTIIWALVGGFVPTLLWLWYWLRQDRRHPEPKKLLFMVFIAGMLIVPIALPLEQFVLTLPITETLQIILNSFIEEFLKFIAPALLVFHSVALDEPLDYVVYLITAALGFAAVENTLFMMTPIAAQDASLVIATGNLRFLGATVLHAVTVGFAGVLLGYHFGKSRFTMIAYSVLGILIATILHTVFNSIIISGTISHIVVVMAGLWLLVVVLTLLMNKLKSKSPN